jgi:hypothetical protein
MQVRAANQEAREMVMSESGVTEETAVQIDDRLQAVEKGVAAVLYYEYEMRPVPPPAQYSPEAMDAAIADMRDAFRLSDIWKAVVPHIPYVGPFLSQNEATYGLMGMIALWIANAFNKRRKDKNKEKSNGSGSA